MYESSQCLYSKCNLVPILAEWDLYKNPFKNRHSGMTIPLLFKPVANNIVAGFNVLKWFIIPLKNSVPESSTFGDSNIRNKWNECVYNSRNSLIGVVFDKLYGDDDICMAIL